MTVIAWDGKTIAADRRATRGDTVYHVRKIWRVGNTVVGLSGASDFCLSWLEWFKAGADPATFVKPATDAESIVAMVVRDGKCFLYDRTPFGEEILQRFCAIGCGREAAIGAMAAGANAHEACLIACDWIAGCGGDIDVEKLE